MNYIVVRLRYYTLPIFQIALNLKGRKAKNNTLVEDVFLIELIKVLYSRLNYSYKLPYYALVTCV